jgi:hypothetical protein
LRSAARRLRPLAEHSEPPVPVAENPVLVWQLLAERMVPEVPMLPAQRVPALAVPENLLAQQVLGWRLPVPKRIWPLPLRLG